MSREVILTARETEVVDLLLAGKRNRDIAVALGLTESTVKQYLYRISGKTGLCGRVSLMLAALGRNNEILLRRAVRP